MLVGALEIFPMGTGKDWIDVDLRVIDGGEGLLSL